MNSVQVDILNQLRYRSFLGYNQLWNKKGDSAKFAYHLRVLEKKGFVEKSKNGYKLSIQGIKFTDYLSMPSPQPIVTIILVVKKGNQGLLNYREKYPFKGYQEFCASKLRQHETIFEAAQERLHRKLGLKGTLTYRGIEFLQVKEKGQLLLHYHLHIFLVEDVRGKNKIGKWFSIKPFKPEKPLPHIDQTLKIALSPGFSIAVTDMIKEGDCYTGYVTHSYTHFNPS